jgi:hypothetical protein
MWSKMYIGLHVKYPLFLSHFHETWIFPTVFPKILKTLWKSVQWEPSCSTWTDGRTDKTKLMFAFRNFWNAPNTVDLTRIFAPNTIYSTNNRLMPHKGLYTHKSTQGILQFPLQHCLKVWISRGFASTTERINLFPFAVLEFTEYIKRLVQTSNSSALFMGYVPTELAFQIK